MSLAKMLYDTSKRKMTSFLVFTGTVLLSSTVHPRARLLGLGLTILGHSYIPKTFLKDFKETFLAAIRQLSPKEICISGTGTVVLISDKDTYYLSASQLSSLALRQSYYAWRSIRKTPLHAIVPEHWEKTLLNDSLLWRVEKLSDNSPLEIAQVQGILDLFWGCGYNAPLPKKSINSWKETLRFMLGECSSQRWPSRIRQLESRIWRLGPCHGDFTPRNVLFRKDSPVLIDLDRFTWKGIQIFDLVHFEIERYVKSIRTDWFSTATDLFFTRLIDSWKENSYLKGSMDMHPNYLACDLRNFYILQRLSLEIRPDIIPPRSWLRKAKELLLET